MKVLPWSWRDAARGVLGEMTELGADGHVQGLDGFEAGSGLGDVPARHLGVPVLGDAEQPALTVRTVGIWVASVAHITFGAAMMMGRSWGWRRAAGAGAGEATGGHCRA